jgi:hypothetical protein
VRHIRLPFNYGEESFHITTIGSGSGHCRVRARHIAWDAKKIVVRTFTHITLEFAPLIPAFDYVKACEDVDIVLFQHDGFSVAYRDASKRERRERGLTQAVDASAQRLGIHTRLVYS